MEKTESVQDFYYHKFNQLPDNFQPSIGHFNVFRLEDCFRPESTPIHYSRREFYKISLIRGRNLYHYADKSIEISGTTLMFFNPQVPYTWESLSDERTGYFCIFTDSFYTERYRGNIGEMPMFTPGGKPAYVLTQEQDRQISALFDKMLDEMAGNYQYKYDLLQSYTMELIHTAMKMQPTQTIYKHTDANTRITTVFTELLERQFPIETPVQRFTMRSASDFAEQLAMHVNHLNRAVRQTTGMTTSSVIAQRVLNEAKALLRHTDWNISEISYSLGFEEATHFNNFFKKHTQQSPSVFRTV